jgi:hypothetical protein
MISIYAAHVLIMRKFALFVFMALLMVLPIRVHAQVIYSDNFESGVTGWSDNTNETASGFTRYLGRFDTGRKETERVFGVPVGTDDVSIAFDFYRFDSWDDTALWGFDRFEVEIDTVEIFSLQLASYPASQSGTTGSVDWIITAVGAASNQAWGGFPDQRFRVTITARNPGSTLRVKMRADINQGGNDESAGYDNFEVRAVPFAPNIALNKSSRPAAGGTGFFIPGTEVIYQIDLYSTGGALDPASVIITDIIPPNLELFTGNFNGSGGAVTLTDLSAPSSGIICCNTGNISFSNSTGSNPPFGYGGNGGFDSAATGFRITPSGTVRQGVTTPVHLRFEIKARIK